MDLQHGQLRFLKTTDSWFCTSDSKAEETCSSHDDNIFPEATCLLSRNLNGRAVEEVDRLLVMG